MKPSKYPSRPSRQLGFENKRGGNLVFYGGYLISAQYFARYDESRRGMHNA